jgi:hypothetical protein
LAKALMRSIVVCLAGIVKLVGDPKYVNASKANR